MAMLKFLGLLLVICVLAVPNAFALKRIVGGIETTIENRPYQASLQNFLGIAYAHRCGASIISATHLLTAAHCNPGSSMDTFYARVGSTRFNGGGHVIKVASFQPHPDYVDSILDYDFAIVTLSTPLEFDDTVAVIPLSNGNNPADGSTVTVSGWGVTQESATQTPIHLREVDLPVFNQDACRSVYSFLTERQICFGGTPEGGKGACFGDSGGPAVQNGVQYGLVSGGSSCEMPNIPGVYGRISSVRSWITDMTGV